MQWFLKYCKALREKIVTERFLKYCKVLLAVILSIAAIIGLYFVYLGWNWISGNYGPLLTVLLIFVAIIGIGLLTNLGWSWASQNRKVRLDAIFELVEFLVVVSFGLYFAYSGLNWVSQNRKVPLDVMEWFSSFWNWVSHNHEPLRTVGLGVVAIIGIALACWRNITAGKQAKIAIGKPFSRCLHESHRPVG